MNTQYYYACYYALDLTGNEQNNANAFFTTGSGTSSAGPVLVYANPPSGSTNVPLDTNQGPWNNTSFDLLFSEPVSTDIAGYNHPDIAAATAHSRPRCFGSDCRVPRGLETTLHRCSWGRLYCRPRSTPSTSPA